MPLDLNRTSFSELSLLTQCEKRWAFKYLDRAESTASPAMALGSLLHDAIRRWWSDKSLSMTEVIGTLSGNYPHDEAFDQLAPWILDRYQQHYYAERAGAVTVVGAELRFELLLPGTGVVVVAYVDQLDLDGQGRFWLVERKSMKDWRRLDSLAVDPQVTTYIWIARASGLPVVGVKYDAIRTYKWQPEKPTLSSLTEEVLIEQPELTKKAATEIARVRQADHPGVERPVDESFRQLWLDRTDEHIDEALAEMRAALLRRQMLAGGLRPIRNIGSHCSTCPFQAPCWDGLAFGEEVEIVE